MALSNWYFRSQGGICYQRHLSANWYDIKFLYENWKGLFNWGVQHSWIEIVCIKALSTLMFHIRNKSYYAKHLFSTPNCIRFLYENWKVLFNWGVQQSWIEIVWIKALSTLMSHMRNISYYAKHLFPKPNCNNISNNFWIFATVESKILWFFSSRTSEKRAQWW